MSLTENHKKVGGKISVFTVLLAVLILVVGVFGEIPHGNVAKASTATTSVTVLNTPPTWDTSIYIQETSGSGTTSSATSTTPTNSGSLIQWYASATDSSADNYYVIVCNNYASPTPNNGAAPTCGGGNAGHLIAISGSTVSGNQATLSTTTYNGDITEVFYYYAYLCDGNASGAACNSEVFAPVTNPQGKAQSTTSPNVSPFIVNHRPTFTGYVNNSPVNPGATINFVATATDADTYGGYATDTVKLFVCKATDFTGSACGPAGTWATSSFVTNSATATLAISTPYAKGTFGAYGYIIDNHGAHQASGGQQGQSSSFTVNNVTPTIAGASVSLFSSTGTSPLILTNLATATQGFSVQFTVTDQNSCMTASGTAEITNALISVYRSSVGSTSCATPANFNTNQCYPGTAASGLWNYTCTPGACAGTSSATQNWTCTFPLWFNSDATDVGSQFASDNWLAYASVTDSSFASSSRSESSVGTELLQFLGYDLSTTSIAYGGLQPGQSADLLSSTSVALLAEGNVGLDQSLYGDDMCPSYPTCSGNATSTIFVANQKYASSSQTYAVATSTLSASVQYLNFHVRKTTATNTIQSKTTYWGILVPGTITLSGSYIGRNYIFGVTSPATAW
jgi:hypothetical protein